MLKLPFEIWRDIPGWEGYYQASTMGNIRSVDRYVNMYDKWTDGTRLALRRGKVLKPQLQIVREYKRLKVSLYNSKHTNKKVHQLVALTFIPNPNNLPEVNHKDENPLNNQVSNLEWCDRGYNQNYGTCSDRSAKTRSKAIEQLDLNDNLIRSWDSQTQASRELGFNQAAIWSCCNGKKEHYKGYKWRYQCSKTTK